MSPDRLRGLISNHSISSFSSVTFHYASFPAWLGTSLATDTRVKLRSRRGIPYSLRAASGKGWMEMDSQNFNCEWQGLPSKSGHRSPLNGRSVLDCVRLAIQIRNQQTRRAQLAIVLAREVDLLLATEPAAVEFSPQQVEYPQPTHETRTSHSQESGLDHRYWRRCSRSVRIPRPGRFCHGHNERPRQATAQTHGD